MSSSVVNFKNAIEQSLGNVIFGLDHTIHGICVALIARGHVLLEGVPGMGKTLLAKSLAATLGGSFKRIQCTADLMPSDITGVNIYHASKNEFVFSPGPIFADIVLVDEINRTGPKTQSALLQAMEELTVTIDRETHKLPDNFFVIASQNPHEFEGTFPLPESQLDRFLMKLTLDYPSQEMEEKVLRAYGKPGGGHHAQAANQNVLDSDMIDQARSDVEQLTVSDAIYRYITDIANASRAHPQVSLGLSPRGALGLVQCSKIEAALQDKGFVTPDDVKTIASAIMAHRLILSPDAMLEGVTQEQLVENILDQVPVPRSSESDG